jgi:hypothetical protein
VLRRLEPALAPLHGEALALELALLACQVAEPLAERSSRVLIVGVLDLAGQVRHPPYRVGDFPVDAGQVVGGRVLGLLLAELGGDQVAALEDVLEALPHGAVEHRGGDAVLARRTDPGPGAAVLDGAVVLAAGAHPDVHRPAAVAAARVPAAQQGRLGVAVVPGRVLLVERQTLLHGPERRGIDERRDRPCREGDLLGLRPQTRGPFPTRCGAALAVPPSPRLAGVGGG